VQRVAPPDVARLQALVDLRNEEEKLETNPERGTLETRVIPAFYLGCFLEFDDLLGSLE